MTQMRWQNSLGQTKVQPPPEPKNDSFKEYLLWCENNGYRPSPKRQEQFMDLLPKPTRKDDQ